MSAGASPSDRASRRSRPAGVGVRRFFSPMVSYSRGAAVAVPLRCRDGADGIAARLLAQPYVAGS